MCACLFLKTQNETKILFLFVRKASLMMFVIVCSKKININPDNIATPIAASLGDLVTLTILAYLCTFLYKLSKTDTIPFYLTVKEAILKVLRISFQELYMWMHGCIILMYFVLVPVFCYFAYRNDFVRDALYNGWIPILMAMVISR